MERFFFVWVLALLSLYITMTWFRVVGMVYRPENILPGPRKTIVNTDLI